MTDETEPEQTDHKAEQTQTIGQIIIGEIEKIGGILTADPITQAEGEYNIAAGTLRDEASEALKNAEEK